MSVLLPVAVPWVRCSGVRAPRSHGGDPSQALPRSPATAPLTEAREANRRLLHSEPLGPTNQLQARATLTLAAMAPQSGVVTQTVSSEALSKLPPPGEAPF